MWNKVTNRSDFGRVYIPIYPPSLRAPVSKECIIYIIKGDMFVYLSVCLAAPIKSKLGIGAHVDPGSVLGKVKVKVIWRHLANSNKTPYRGPQGPIEFEREAR